MTYNLVWSDVAKSAIQVFNGQFDTSTSLTLSGKGALNYGESQQTNLIRLLENFSSTTAPVNPTRGQHWYNTTTLKMMVYNGISWTLAGGATSSATTPTNPQAGDLWFNSANGHLSMWDGSAWQQLYPSTASSSNDPIKVAYIAEYNAMVDLYNQVAGTPTGTTASTAYGYGQNVIQHATTAMTNADWKSLNQKMFNVLSHQGATAKANGIDLKGFIIEHGDTAIGSVVSMTGSVGGVAGATQGTTTAGTYSTTLYAAQQLATARATAVTASLETTASTPGTRSRTASWAGNVVHDVTLTFTSAAHMAAYFNSGGKVSMTPSISNSPSSSINNEWLTYLNTVGTVTLSQAATTVSGTASIGTTSKGFYNITNTLQTIFTGNTAGVYSTGNLKMEAVLDSATVLHIRVTFSSSGTVTGATQSALSMTKSSSVYLSDPVMAYPTAASSGTL